MRSKCKQCRECTFDCICDDESLTSCSPLPDGLAEIIIQRNLEETELMICIEMIQEAGLLDQFKDFYLKRITMPIFDAIKEFGRLHPDKFYVSDETESYGKYVVINQR